MDESIHQSIMWHLVFGLSPRSLLLLPPLLCPPRARSLHQLTNDPTHVRMNICTSYLVVLVPSAWYLVQPVADTVYIFISPPSLGELEKRLRGRGTETEDSIQKRLANSKKEMDYGHCTGNFDRVFVNANLKATFEEIAVVFKEWYPELDEVAPDDEQKNCTSSSKCAIS